MNEGTFSAKGQAKIFFLSFFQTGKNLEKIGIHPSGEQQYQRKDGEQKTKRNTYEISRTKTRKKERKKNTLLCNIDNNKCNIISKA